jgi:hypothetical protein
MTKRVSYHITSKPGRGWAILRDDQPVGIRSELFDAVALATHLAEREAALPRHATRVAMRTARDARKAAQWAAVGGRSPSRVRAP